MNSQKTIQWTTVDYSLSIQTWLALSPFFLAVGQTLPIQLRVARYHSKIAGNVPFHTHVQHLPTYGEYSPASMEKGYEAVVAQ